LSRKRTVLGSVSFIYKENNVFACLDSLSGFAQGVEFFLELGQFFWAEFVDEGYEYASFAPVFVVLDDFS
jgi:hypothetical protein